MHKKNKAFTDLKGGNVVNDSYQQVKASKLLSTIAIIIIFLIVVYIIYKIWKYIYDITKEDTKCVPSKGCLLFSGVKNGTDAVTIKSNRMPPSIHGADYTMCVWLYIKSSNFTKSNRPWKTVMYRGGNLEDNPAPNGWVSPDNQYTVQPGVWLGGDNNKLLIRWDTLGRVSNINPCCKTAPCKTDADISKRCMQEDDTIRFCGRNSSGTIGWEKEPSNAYSMNPYINPPNKQCSATVINNSNVWNTNDSNTDNETCIDNIPLDRWFHLTIVTQTQSSDVYIDGKLVNTVAFNSPPVPLNSADLILCKDSANSSIGKNGFSGGLTQVRYFNMAISPYDILKIYSWGPHPFEVVDPDKLKNELESIGGSIHISASVS